jgi:hypothetical protein
MTIGVSHTKVVAGPDNGTSEVSRDEWNGEGAHTLSGVPTSSADNAVVRSPLHTAHVRRFIFSRLKSGTEQAFEIRPCHEPGPAQFDGGDDLVSDPPPGGPDRHPREPSDVGRT